MKNLADSLLLYYQKSKKKLPFVLCLFTIVSTALAGGIRGAYERMFI